MNSKLTTIALAVLMITWTIAGCSGKQHLSTPVEENRNMIANVVYGNNLDRKGNMEALTLDVYLPATMEKGTKYPLILFIHGGGYLTGDKKSAAEKCGILADSGFVAASINYRLGWDKSDEICDGNPLDLENAGYRAVQDANAALRFLIAQAQVYSIDTNWIFVSGSSAGAITAFCVAYFNDENIKKYYPGSWNMLGSLTRSGNTLTNRYTIKGISSISGGLPDTNLINTGKAIPAILFHGALDETVPPDYGHFYSCENYPYLAGSLSIYRTLSRNNVPAILHMIPGAGHGHEGDSGYSDELKMQLTANFFHGLIKEKTARTGVRYDTDE